MNEILDRPSPEPEKQNSGRPVVIIAVCFLGVFAMIMRLNHSYQARHSAQREDWMYFIVYTILMGAFLFGLWKMKRWGAWGLIGLLVLSQVMLVGDGQMNLINFILGAGFILVIALHMKNMS